jgi:hypothetical protein
VPPPSLTGFIDVDELIELYRQRSVADPTYGAGPRQLPVEALRDPEVANGLCDLVASDFVRYLKANGIKARRETEDDKDAPYGVAWGYDDPVRNPGWGNHMLVTVERGDVFVTIDWTAAQFGYRQFPLVQKLIAGEWKRR